MIHFDSYKVFQKSNLLFEIDSFTLKKGEIQFLLGKNGSGKSTFLKSIVGIIDTKEIFELEGQSSNLFSSKQLAKKIAYVPSKLVVNDFTTVEDFILLGRYPHQHFLSTYSNDERQLVIDLLNEFGLRNFEKRFLYQLSDGQLQMVGIARALAQEVDFVLLDEPTSFLDYKNKDQLYQLINRISKDKNIGFLVVTHDIEYVYEHFSGVKFVDLTEKKLKSIEFNNLKMKELINIIYAD